MEEDSEEGREAEEMEEEKEEIEVVNETTSKETVWGRFLKIDVDQSLLDDKTLLFW
ncbi:14208_t:CDS:2 [Entrophospora sp. SA101]|nr:14208_t:CDS:2 [Entrophospora sp. SA101]